MVSLFLKYKLFLTGIGLILLMGCFSNSEKEQKISKTSTNEKTSILEKRKTKTQKIFVKKEIPVLCYHAIRNSTKNDSPNQKTYSVSPTAFALQMKALNDNGYKTISPEELYTYWTSPKSLPKKSILITFDDGRREQYTIGVKEMDKYNFKGVFFIMTVAIGKPNYMTEAQIKDLSLSGHTIGLHTWDHHKVTQFTKEDWNLQLIKPRKKLENITGKSVQYFAYPFGVWNTVAADTLKNQGYKLAFIVYGKNDITRPLFTMRRMIVPGSYSSDDLMKGIQKMFGNE